MKKNTLFLNKEDHNLKTKQELDTLIKKFKSECNILPKTGTNSQPLSAWELSSALDNIVNFNYVIENHAKDPELGLNWCSLGRKSFEHAKAILENDNIKVKLSSGDLYHLAEGCPDTAKFILEQPGLREILNIDIIPNVEYFADSISPTT